MKHLLIIFILTSLLITTSSSAINAQIKHDSLDNKREFTSMTEALKNPSSVYRLNLSNLNLSNLSDSIWSNFNNLEFLSLKDDNLTEIPSQIGNLRNLKV